MNLSPDFAEKAEILCKRSAVEELYAPSGRANVGQPAGTVSMSEIARFQFKGKLLPDVFIEFAQHRARRLDLALEIGRADSSAISMTVRGAPDLLDAFEMACSLGPYDCLVLDVVRSA